MMCRAVVGMYHCGLIFNRLAHARCTVLALSIHFSPCLHIPHVIDTDLTPQHS